jgi:tripartite ATP-independent transporter DctM subunit
MTSPQDAAAGELAQPPDRLPTGWRRILGQGENLLVAVALGLLAILPLLEILLRQFRTGISGSSIFVQHATLFVGMIGGAIAARERRLLALSPITSLLRGRAKSVAAVLSNSFAAAVTFFLCAAAVQFLLAERESGKILPYGIPSWLPKLVLPAGFALVAMRLFWHASHLWKGRLATLLLTAAFVWFGVQRSIAPETLSTPGLIALLAATALGAPVFTTIGGAALILLWGGGYPIASMAVMHDSLVTNPSLPTIPLFTLAGYFLAEGGASRRLIRVFQALVGQFRGGPAVVTALVCAFFTSFTGASGVTILALGGLLMPVLLAAKYKERTALGLLTSAGSLGLLFPPCLPLIFYAIVAGNIAATLGVEADITIQKMFLGGILPGAVLVALTAWWGIRAAPGAAASTQRFDANAARSALWEAKWELILPVVALVALFSGYATPVEAAAVTALYAFIVETFVYRDLKLASEVLRVMVQCGLLVGGVLLILGVAMGFTNYLVLEQVPDRLVEWTVASISSPYLFLLVLNGFLLIVGCLMDVYSAIAVVVPLIVPIGLRFGIDPIHLGIIFLANLELGFLTPPVGMNLFLSSYRFNKPMAEVTRAVIPMLLVLLVGVLLITYAPPLTTVLPRLLK